VSKTWRPEDLSLFITCEVSTTIDFLMKTASISAVYEGSIRIRTIPWPHKTMLDWALDDGGIEQHLRQHWSELAGIMTKRTLDI
jgi:hypothetical protein